MPERGRSSQVQMKWPLPPRTLKRLEPVEAWQRIRESSHRTPSYLQEFELNTRCVGVRFLTLGNFVDPPT